MPVAITPPVTDPRPDPPGEGSTPVVSILVRSMGRSSLDWTLASVAEQTADAAEVIVVNASGRPHPPLATRCGRYPLRLVDPGRRLARAAAANAALDAARGGWLLFIDDDDQMDPVHVQRLLDNVLGGDLVLAAYAGVRLVAADGRPVATLDEPFDADRLLLANFLPIHAVLFSRAAIDAGCRFDERFAVYEDWDFWQQLARLGPLRHVPGISATYRLVGDSGLSADRDEAASTANRTRFYEKWLPRLDAGQLERMAAAAERTRARLAQSERERHEDNIRLCGERDAALAQSSQALALAAEQHARAESAEAEVAHVRADLAAALGAYGRLEQGYQAIEGSLSWRVTAPLRRLRPAVDPGRWLRWLWRAIPITPDTRLRLRDGLARHAWTAGLVRRLAPHAAAPAAAAAEPATPAPAFDKESVRADAEAELGRFLADGGRIDLRCALDPPDVSVVVVVFNQAGLSHLCLQALAASDGVRCETIIVDNGSTDRIPALLDRVDGATVLRPGENLGFLRAVNRAAARARGRHLLLLNNDALVEPGTIASAVARLDGEPGIGAVGGPILLWDGRLQEAGSIIWRDGSCVGYGRGDDPARPEYSFVRDVDYCSGAFLMLRRALWTALGGFDDDYAPAYYEESDFCARLWERGQRTVYDPAVRVRHFEFASEGASGHAITLQQRNRERFLRKRGRFVQSQPVPSPAAVLRARQRLSGAGLRVLVIDDRVPLPWLGQGYPRAAAIVAALARAGHAVTHYPLQFPHEEAADVARALPETVEVMTGLGASALEEFLARREGFFDAAIVSRPHNMQALRRLLDADPARLRGVRIVYDAEAMFSLRDIAKAALGGRPLAPAEQRRRIADELALAAGADAVLAVSALEASHYREAGHRRVAVLGHGIDPVAGTPGYVARRGFLFVGALSDDDTPNSDSMRWFVREVWPRVQQQLGPTVSLDIVGDCSAPSVLALQGPTVRIRGRAEDLAAVLDAARVFVVPTRYAAGVAHKAHEAAARGLPMVTTPLIAEQLGWQALVAVGADAAGFAAGCIALHEDAARWQRMRDDLLAAVARDCSPEAFDAELRRALVADPRANGSDQSDTLPPSSGTLPSLPPSSPAPL